MMGLMDSDYSVYKPCNWNDAKDCFDRMDQYFVFRGQSMHCGTQRLPLSSLFTSSRRTIECEKDFLKARTSLRVLSRRNFRSYRNEPPASLSAAGLQSGAVSHGHFANHVVRRRENPPPGSSELLSLTPKVATRKLKFSVIGSTLL
jgi:hypothetical protein